MLKTFAVVLLATAMSVGLAEAKGPKAKPKALSPCQTDQQAKYSGNDLQESELFFHDRL